MLSDLWYLIPVLNRRLVQFTVVTVRPGLCDLHVYASIAAAGLSWDMFRFHQQLILNHKITTATFLVFGRHSAQIWPPNLEKLDTVGLWTVDVVGQHQNNNFASASCFGWAALVCAGLVTIAKVQGRSNSASNSPPQVNPIWRRATPIYLGINRQHVTVRA